MVISGYLEKIINAPYSIEKIMYGTARYSFQSKIQEVHQQGDKCKKEESYKNISLVLISVVFTDIIDKNQN
jgi:hypothetical protein